MLPLATPLSPFTLPLRSPSWIGISYLLGTLAWPTSHRCIAPRLLGLSAHSGVLRSSGYCLPRPWCRWPCATRCCLVHRIALAPLRLARLSSVARRSPRFPVFSVPRALTSGTLATGSSRAYVLEVGRIIAQSWDWLIGMFWKLVLCWPSCFVTPSASPVPR